MSEKTNDALDLCIEAINKQYGNGSAQLFDSKVPLLPGIKLFSSGSIGLDIALCGGFVFGRIIEIYGPESSGKTTLALQAIANAQKVDTRKCFYIDAEHALDLKYAATLGVDIQRLGISQPDSGEQGLGILDMVIRSGGASVVVVDSVAALVPQKELEGDMGDPQMGIQARLMSQALRKITAIAHQNNTAVIFINQLRMKIGVMFGNPETTTGGNALKFYASQRLDIRAGEKQKDEEEVIGRETTVKVVKNKIGPPFKAATFSIVFGEGINYHDDLINVATEKNIIEKSGAWYSYKGNKVGQGKNNTIKFLVENPDITKEIDAAVRANN